MKPIQLSSEEKKFLLPYVQARLATLLERTSNPPKKYITALQSLIKKLSDTTEHTYSDFEKPLSCGCIKDGFERLLADVVPLTSGYRWLQLPDSQKVAMGKVDIAKSILHKFGDYKIREGGRVYTVKPRFYSTGFEAIEKLRKSDTIYLSHYGGDKFYKIGFVYNGIEYTVFESRHQVAPLEISFGKVPGGNVQEYGELNFSIVTSRKEALSILTQLNHSEYPEDIISFFQAVLN